MNYYSPDDTFHKGDIVEIIPERRRVQLVRAYRFLRGGWVVHPRVAGFKSWHEDEMRLVRRKSDGS